ncbi:hypothetical protein KY290_008875 [Solanum tuberosum]|uniref:Uncharacterized protein n=1 Tax=Solanum tuberosum TaxID=4113 RepID=A0ABQ7VT63_SOLTU|nr:hypothetical protein KY289_027405 [Solanum tuberosum]KAH0697727.1 hypothetical protein KY289_015209 [Solanum tuberosum]KAH0713236.1 hypothetical protein KY289_009195 [Solanum tuberosum]KAH0715928.1 hypothetical protein KY284_008833 [Solanum tuberosum]KAH0747168.1 hypothetical protein KY285_008825 [Solanum tuberosum]
MQASKASAEAAPGSTQGTSKEHLLGITKEVGKDPGLPEALRARMLALEDEVNMVMGQYLGAVEGFLGKFPSAYAVSSTPGIALNGHVAVGGNSSFYLILWSGCPTSASINRKISLLFTQTPLSYRRLWQLELIGSDSYHCNLGTQALELICQSTVTTNLYFEVKRLRSFPSR